MHARRTTTGLALAVAAAICLTACSSGSTAAGSTAAGSAATPSSTAAASSSSPAAATGTPVLVTEKEFSITMPKTSFAAGTYTFKVTNAGTFSHNLTIEGPGVDKQATATLQSGETGQVTVTLQAGSYELWCSVDSHKDKGMDTKITVT
jgi:uncharacterized cupredoxin-like copper-binding protein